MAEIVGIVNITRDSFSDGGRYFAPDQALAHAHALAEAGASVLDLGPASTHPDAEAVSAAEEIARLEPVVGPLMEAGLTLSVDSYQVETQAWCMERGVAWLNDIQGFPEASLYPALAASTCRLVVMHSVQRRGQATRERTDAGAVLTGIIDFFEARFAALEAAGVSRDRLVLDPGMGFFLGDTPEPSLRVLQALPELRARFGVPILVSVSRKSFLGGLTGRGVSERGAATLAAELYAAAAGADYIRTHDVAALRDGLRVWEALYY